MTIVPLSEAILDNGQCRLETTGGWWEIRGAVTNAKMMDDCDATGDRRLFVRVAVLSALDSITGEGTANIVCSNRYTMELCFLWEIYNYRGKN